MSAYAEYFEQETQHKWYGQNERYPEPAPWQEAVEGYLKAYKYKGPTFKALATFVNWTALENYEVREGSVVHSGGYWPEATTPHVNYLFRTAKMGSDAETTAVDLERALSFLVVENAAEVAAWVQLYVQNFNAERKQAAKAARKGRQS